MGEELRPRPEPAGWTTAERTLAALAGLLLVAIVATVGWATVGQRTGDEVGGAGSAAPEPSATSVRTPAPTRRSTPSPVPSASSAQQTATPQPSTFTISAISEVETYRFHIEMEGSGANSPLAPLQGVIEVNGRSSTDPEQAIDLVLLNTIGQGSSLRLVVVGDQAWVDYGSGSLVEVEGDELADARRAADEYRAEKLFADTVGELPRDAVQVGRAVRNGMEVTDYRIEPSVWTDTGPLAGVRVEGTFSIHDALQFPVRTEVVFTSATDPTGTFRVLVEILAINDPADRVERPE